MTGLCMACLVSCRDQKQDEGRRVEAVEKHGAEKSVLAIVFDGDVVLPAQSLDDRIRLLNDHLKNAGVADQDVRVVKSEGTENISCEEVSMKNPAFRDLLKFTSGTSKVNWKMIDGQMMFYGRRDDND
jgi:hypothetical protein